MLCHFHNDPEFSNTGYLSSVLFHVSCHNLGSRASYLPQRDVAAMLYFVPELSVGPYAQRSNVAARRQQSAALRPRELLDQVRDALRLKRYAVPTEEAFVLPLASSYPSH